MTDVHYDRRLPDLQAYGALVEALLTVPKAVAEAASRNGEQVAKTQAEMLVDTGANLSLIDERIPETLGLSPSRPQEVVLATGTAERRPLYLMGIIIPCAGDYRELYWEGNFVACPTGTRDAGLLGRDFLRFFRFTYDGPQEFLSLDMDELPG